MMSAVDVVQTEATVWLSILKLEPGLHGALADAIGTFRWGIYHWKILLNPNFARMRIAYASGVFGNALPVLLSSDHC